jgi:hypothetical protein
MIWLLKPDQPKQRVSPPLWMRLRGFCRVYQRSGQAESGEPQTLAIIDKLLRLPAFGTPFETTQHMPSLAFDQKTLTMSDESGIILPAAINCNMTASFVGDGFTTGFAPCVYRKLKLGRSGGEVRQGWRVI